jgi:heme exporter protein D
MYVCTTLSVSSVACAVEVVESLDEVRYLLRERER